MAKHRIATERKYQPKVSYISENPREISEMMALDEILLGDQYGVSGGLVTNRPNKYLTPHYRNTSGQHNDADEVTACCHSLTSSTPSLTSERKLSLEIPAVRITSSSSENNLANLTNNESRSSVKSKITSPVHIVLPNRQHNNNHLSEITQKLIKAQRHYHIGRATFQGRVYNFLERPSGWKCILYHISVIFTTTSYRNRKNYYATQLDFVPYNDDSVQEKVWKFVKQHHLRL